MIPVTFSLTIIGHARFHLIKFKSYSFHNYLDSRWSYDTEDILYTSDEIFINVRGL